MRQGSVARRDKVPVRLGMAVICASGFMDAYSYLLHGKVFATGQTGNIVLLSLNLAQGSWSGVLHYLVSVLSVIVGVLLSKLVLVKVHKGSSRHMQRSVAIFEALVFLIIALLPQGVPDLPINVTISFCAALSFENFRTFGTKSVYSSIFCTGNLRSLGETLYDGLFAGNRHELHRSLRYATLVLSFCFGAVVCKLLIDIVGQLACLSISVLFLLATRFIADPDEE